MKMEGIRTGGPPYLLSGKKEVEEMDGMENG